MELAKRFPHQMSKKIHIFKYLFMSLDVKNIVEETPSATYVLLAEVCFFNTNLPKPKCYSVQLAGTVVIK
jgi:hypothetical protein